METNTLPTTIIKLKLAYERALATLEEAAANRYQPGGMAVFLAAYHEKDRTQRLYAQAAHESCQAEIGLMHAKELARHGQKVLVAVGRLQ